jgi:hypothetical protein
MTNVELVSLCPQFNNTDFVCALCSPSPGYVAVESNRSCEFVLMDIAIEGTNPENPVVEIGFHGSDDWVRADFELLFAYRRKLH